MSGAIPTWTVLAWVLLLGGLSTDYYWGRFDLCGPWEKRPLADPTKDRWPKKKIEE